MLEYILKYILEYILEYVGVHIGGGTHWCRGVGWPLLLPWEETALRQNNTWRIMQYCNREEEEEVVDFEDHL